MNRQIAERFMPVGTPPEVLAWVVGVIDTIAPKEGKLIAGIHKELLALGPNVDEATEPSEQACWALTEAATFVFLLQAFAAGVPTAAECFQLWNDVDFEIDFDWSVNGWSAEFFIPGESESFATVDCTKVSK